ncbi:MAG: FkbM family methyltransferase [Gammaproteobacteria bacterium]|nr:FkbM family methyltransferase [Gammaproteobacteria bacterium]
MGLLKSIKKRIDWATKVKFDKRTGFYKYNRFGKTIYIRYPRHYLEVNSNIWNCENLVFHYYLPNPCDVIVDLGAGYGEEAIYLSKYANGFRYIGVEAQPVIYECLANTFYEAGEEFVASPYVITDKEKVKFASGRSYAAVGEIPAAYIDIPTMNWEKFIQSYDISRIDLFKMNIEGAEQQVIENIKDFNIIKRFIISCHDFRADNGEGEWYRTKDIVTRKLEERGYVLKGFNYGISWADDWIYAERGT